MVTKGSTGNKVGTKWEKKVEQKVAPALCRTQELSYSCYYWRPVRKISVSPSSSQRPIHVPFVRIPQTLKQNEVDGEIQGAHCREAVL